MEWVVKTRKANGSLNFKLEWVYFDDFLLLHEYWLNSSNKAGRIEIQNI